MNPKLGGGHSVNVEVVGSQALARGGWGSGRGFSRTGLKRCHFPGFWSPHAVHAVSIFPGMPSPVGISLGKGG